VEVEHQVHLREPEAAVAEQQRLELQELLQQQLV
tara:strand:- start:317 stop:418 length:102 start_codon:yes stop_codon:yes gene_type:complete